MQSKRRWNNHLRETVVASTFPTERIGSTTGLQNGRPGEALQQRLQGCGGVHPNLHPLPWTTTHKRGNLGAKGTDYGEKR